MQWTVERDAVKANVPLIPSDMSEGSRAVSNASSGLSKLLENPLIPIGMGATVGCLIGMLVATLRRSTKDAQLFMRGRVIAQGLTVGAIVGGAALFGIGAPANSMKRQTPPAHLMPGSTPKISQ
ncbi:unnamed protein product [Caenorhabditis auriculariae]|uniref:HIG1 domain-containing protein n=1 Tax=Caenorhabditis auriculariae TaxID=2777116 RepID=A0A8S1H822_9PELO|nr:unnamed protein product [Caenorhabditis auriculariae]